MSRKAIEAQAEETWDAAKAPMKTAEVGAKRLKACLALVAVDDGPGAKALADAIIALIKHSGEMTGGRADIVEGPSAVQRLEKTKADIIDLLVVRAKKGDG